MSFGLQFALACRLPNPDDAASRLFNGPAFSNEAARGSRSCFSLCYFSEAFAEILSAGRTHPWMGAASEPWPVLWVEFDVVPGSYFKLLIKDQVAHSGPVGRLTQGEHMNNLWYLIKITMTNERQRS
jgi:hypothetical protein